MVDAQVDRLQWRINPRLALMLLGTISLIVLASVMPDGTADAPYDRRNNVNNYYGECPGNPFWPEHLWFDQDAWYRVSYGKPPVYGNMAVCFLCGAHIA